MNELVKITPLTSHGAEENIPSLAPLEGNLPAAAMGTLDMLVRHTGTDHGGIPLMPGRLIVNALYAKGMVLY